MESEKLTQLGFKLFKKEILIVLLLIGCAGERPKCEDADYTIDRYGICVVDDELGHELMEAVVPETHRAYSSLTGNYHSDSWYKDWYKDHEFAIAFTDEDLPEGSGGMTTWDFGRRHWWIAVRPGYESPQEIVRVITHEFLHVFNYIWHDETDEDHLEPEGYFEQSLPEDEWRQALEWQMFIWVNQRVEY